jgi:hypothetical protein
VFIIGIDPHKGSHVAAVLDPAERLVDQVRVRADRQQRERLLAFAARFEPRCWAVEGAAGVGALLAQQLVAAGEHVLDVPAKLSARVRALDTECSDKTDSHDARSAAIVALRHPRLRIVQREDHSAVLRLLAKRHHELIAQRTRTICRLHAVLATSSPAGSPGASRRPGQGRNCAGSVPPTPSASSGVARPSSSSPRCGAWTATSPSSRSGSATRSPCPTRA